MKLITALLLTAFAHSAIAECDMKVATQTTSERVVSAPYNVTREAREGQCRMKFNLNIDGEEYTVDSTENGILRVDYLCIDAVDKGREGLLSNLGGKFRTESIMVCAEGKLKKDMNRPVKVGDTVLENELGRSKNDKYFTHKGAKCRNFVERLSQSGTLVVNNGVMCKVDNSHNDWVVLDKW